MQPGLGLPANDRLTQSNHSSLSPPLPLPASQNEVRSSLTGGGPSANTPQGQRRQKLRAELDELRGAQAGVKGSRGKVLDELKALQESTGKKVRRDGREQSVVQRVVQ